MVTFEDETAGTSVVGLGTVHPMLDIQANGDAVVIENLVAPKAYGAPSPDNFGNTCLEDADGNRLSLAESLSEEKSAKGFGIPQSSGFFDWAYDFSFAPGNTVSSFSIKVFDFGDYNPSLSTSHNVSLKAYDDQNNLISTDEISFTTSAQGNPTDSVPYGNLLYGAGDACDASFGEPGYFELAVDSATGIYRLELRATGQDPKVGFDSINFSPCTRTIGFWKNHTWPTCVDVGSSETICESDGSAKDAELKEQKGILWNATGKNHSMLCAQLIAAKLNCDGSSCDPDGFIDAADAVLIADGVLCKEPDTWAFEGKAEKRDVASLAAELDAFNNGFHCAD
jgi:hypothetical protein